MAVDSFFKAPVAGARDVKPLDREPLNRRGGLLPLTLCLILATFMPGCAEVETVSPGRGAEREVGSMATVYPSDGEPRRARHGRWRGMEGERVVWEVRYTRGVPTGPYREWNDSGELIATWPHNWEGGIEGWARWFENGEPVFKVELSPESPPDFDPVGRAERLREWAQELPP